MHARITTFYVPQHRYTDALAILNEIVPSLRQHDHVEGLTILADRPSGKLTVIFWCASAEACGHLPAIHLKGLAAGDPRQEDIAVMVHEHYAETS
jgi:hypothetical protein